MKAHDPNNIRCDLDEDGCSCPIKITDAQLVALLWMVEHGQGKIERWPGGFWTIPKMKAQKTEHYAAYNTAIPQWHTGTNTVRAMEKARLVKRVENPNDPNMPEWAAPREITDRGRQSVEKAVDAGQTKRATKNWKLADALKLEAVWGYVGDREGK